MSSSHDVQLGTVFLELDNGLESYHGGPWLDLDSDILQSGNFAEHERETIETLLYAVGDVGLGFSMTCQDQGSQLLVRATILPSDASGSQWKRVKRNDRPKYLRRLFHSLRKGWDGDGDGDCLMGRTVGLRSGQS